MPLAAGATGLNYIIHQGDAKDLPDDQPLDFATPAGRCGCSPPRRAACCRRGRRRSADTDISKQKAHWIDRSTVAWQTGRRPTARRTRWSPRPTGGVSVVDGELTGTYDHVAAAGAAQRAHRGPARRGSRTCGRTVASPWTGRTSPRSRAALRGQLAGHRARRRGRAARRDRRADPRRARRPLRRRRRRGPRPDVGAAGRRRLARVGADGAERAPAPVRLADRRAPKTVPMRRDDAHGVWRCAATAPGRGRPTGTRSRSYAAGGTAVVTNVGDRPVLGGARRRTPRAAVLVDLDDPALAPGRLDARCASRRWRRPRGLDDLRAARARLLDRRRDRAGRATAAPTWRSPTATATACATCATLADAGPQHRAPAAGVRHRHDRGGPRRRSASRPATCASFAARLDRAAGVRRRRSPTSDGFNWGYDPLHYTTPEGSYATDPDGTARTRRVPRRWSQGAQRRRPAGGHGRGLQPHAGRRPGRRSRCSTGSCPATTSGSTRRGAVETSTCCPNTATEHAMMEKLMVDSVVTWAREYKVDGFRFDLMGHHPKANMLAVRAAARRADPRQATASTARRSTSTARAGTSARSPNNARFVQATQAQHGRHRHRHVHRPAARRRPRRRPVRRGPAHPGLRQRACTPTRTASPVNGTPAEQQRRGCCTTRT